MDSPTHGLCNVSWCKYKKSEIQNEVYNHGDHFHLPRVVMDAIKPIFRALSDPEHNYIKKCLHGKSQNANESVNLVTVAKNNIYQNNEIRSV
jgi:hypothetical protein